MPASESEVLVGRRYLERSFLDAAMRLFVRNDGDFRRLAIHELRKSRKRTLVAHAAGLACGIRGDDFARWGRPGIRAQLLDLSTGKLEMDFRYEGDDRSFHVLNAVSPAFTCAIPFCAYLVDQIGRLVAR